MSHQEKRSILNFAGTLLIAVVYSWYMWTQRPQVDPYAPEIFVFWGKFFVLSLVFSIVVQIVAAIIKGIFKGIAAGVARTSPEPEITDERDEIVDLKSSRIALYFFAAGVMLAMGLLWAGQIPSVMFATLFISGLLASLLGNVAAFLYYRAGVSLG